MAQKRLSMQKVRKVLRLKHELGGSHREIATSLKIAHTTVGEYPRRAAKADGTRNPCLTTVSTSV